MGIRSGLVALVAAGCLGACGGGGDGGGSSAPPTFSVGGNVTGLSGSGLVLQLNGSATLGVSANGFFTFPTQLPTGSAYNVTVSNNPTGPVQVCKVFGGSGTISGNITTIAVSCSSSVSVGGTVTGLHGSSVFLELNGVGNQFSVNGPFTFTTQVPIGSTYNVAVQADPSGQICTVTGGSGTTTSADVTNVGVACVDVFYTVGGTVSGLRGSGLVLQLNGGGNLGVSADGAFTFATPLPRASTYNVTVLSNPTGPKQLCTVTLGSGTLFSNVDFVSVSCRTPLTVGGTVSGLTGPGLVLRNNCGNDLPIAGAGSFMFPGELPFSSSTYGVSVLTQPAGQTCVVAKGAGTGGSSDVEVTCGVPGFSVTSVNDPLVPQQWHLRNTCQTGFADTPGVAGMDVNVDAAYGLFNLTGSGVIVGVVDSGLEIAHEDLAANIVPNGSWNFNSGTNDPTSLATNGDHGTSVAGLIAMAQNTVGGIGVAPGSALKGFNFLSSPQFESEFLSSIGGSTANPNSSDVFIFNQSFGISTNIPLAVNPLEEAQYLAGVTSLRSGKGAIYVKAAGNGFGTIGSVSCNSTLLSCANANFDPTHTLPYQIVVGSVAASGIKASYSTTGSAIWVSAPGGEFGRNAALSGGAGTVFVQPAMVTTDQSGCAKGFSTNTTNNGSIFDNGAAPNASCNYWNGMNGTSSAAPVTAGVIALILEANPALTWRDVKHILASTARQIDPFHFPVNCLLGDGIWVCEPPWTTNHASPAPFRYHNWYGFGMVDAAAAVVMAKSYTLGQLGAFTNTGFIPSGAALNLAIPVNSVTGATSTISVPAGTVQVVEAVQIRVNATHPSIRQLGIELVSPQGTRSVLKNSNDGYNAFAANLVDQVFLSNVFYGENPAGTWTIKVVNPFGGGQPGTLVNWAIRAYGH